MGSRELLADAAVEPTSLIYLAGLDWHFLVKTSSSPPLEWLIYIKSVKILLSSQYFLKHFLGERVLVLVYARYLAWTNFDEI